MKASIKITDSQAEIQSKINEAVIKRIQKNAKKNVVRDLFRDWFRRKIEEQPAWESVKSGLLRVDFGIPRGTEDVRLEEILRIWLNSIRVETKLTRRARSFVFSFDVKGINADWADVTSSNAAVVINDSDNPDARQEITWLSWLLTAGDSAVVFSYRVAYGNFPNSRSGGGIMVFSPSDVFRVDPAFSGTADNNFVTKAILSMITDKSLERELSKLMVRYVK